MSTAHSEYGKIEKLVIKRPEDALIDQSNIDQQWKSLNYLDCPNLEKAVDEYDNFEKLLRSQDTQIHYLPKSEAVSMDSIYCRDAAITTNSGMIICRMGKEARMGEPIEEQKLFESTDIPILGIIESPGSVEGGDVAWLDESTLAVGHTYRTNYEGIEQLRDLLGPIGVELVVAEMPHHRGPEDVFHLMSVFSPVDEKKAVVYSPLMPINFRNELLEREYELIEVPDEEYDSMGCNVLATAPSECVMVAGNPITHQRLIDAGCTVHTYEGQHISVMGGGGPTCLTRPILRD